jgi:hypothetical protein
LPAAAHPVVPPQWPPQQRPPAEPARPPVLARRWPGPIGGARAGVLGAVSAAAAIGAVSIPLDRPGIGWLVGVSAGTAALATAAWPAANRGQAEQNRADQKKADEDTADRSDARPGATGAPGRAEPHPARLGFGQLFWAAATVALIGVGAVRAAGWLFVLCLLTAGMTACLAVAGGRSLRGLLLSAVIPVAAVFRSIPWVAAGLSRSDQRGPGPAIGRIIATAAVSLGLLVVFGALFASADAAFADLLGAALPEVSTGDLGRWCFLFPTIGAGLLGGAYLLAAPPNLTGLDGRPARRVRRLEWALPVALLDALFAAFVLVQVTVLFGGADHVLRTAGLTYAQYARGGFWQLLAVSALTLLVIAAATRWAPRDKSGDRLLIRLLLGTLALLSLVVVGSALFRMNVYTEAYGATRLRLLVATCELWLGLLFVLVLIAGVRLRAAWLPRLVLGAAVLALLGLAAANPDRLIADRNIDRYADTGRLDVRYLSGLSPDAVPALDRLPDRLRGCALADIADELETEPDDWRRANLGRTRARAVLAAHPLPAGAQDCPISSGR